MCDRKWYKRPTRLSVYLFLWVIQCYKHLFGWKNWISSIFSICPSRNYCIMYNGLIIINHGMMSCSSLLDIYRACLLNDDIILINQFKVFFRFFVFFFLFSSRTSTECWGTIPATDFRYKLRTKWRTNKTIKLKTGITHKCSGKIHFLLSVKKYGFSENVDCIQTKSCVNA